MTSITFRPTYEEFVKYKSTFLENFVKKWKKHDYLIVPESANQDTANHYQIFLDSDARPDSIKRTLRITILKGIELTNFKIAVKVKKIKTNYHGVIGYCMKEQLDCSKITTNMNHTLLLQYRDDYLKLSAEKRMKVDKVRVNIRNLPDIFCSYVKSNHDRLLDDNIVGNGKFNYRDHDVKVIFLDMLQNGYAMLPVLLNRDLRKIVGLCRLALQGKLTDFPDDYC